MKKVIGLILAVITMLSCLSVANEAFAASVSTPTGVKVSVVTSTCLKISWKKVSKADGYYVYRATSKSGKYKKIKTISKKSTISYKNTGLKRKKTYYYKVKAYKGSKKSKYSKVASNKTCGWGQKLSFKTKYYDVHDCTKEQYETYGPSGGFYGITFKITGESDATGYQYRGKFGDQNYSDTQTFNTTKKTFCVSGQDGPEEFQFRTFKKLSNGKKVYGKWCNAKVTQSDNQLWCDEWQEIQNKCINIDIWKGMF